MSRKPAEPKPNVNVIGMVGLDGGQDALSTGIARRLQRGGLSVMTYAPAPVSVTISGLADESGITLCESLREMASLISVPRIVWLTLPAGLATRLAMDALQPVLAAGDIIVNTADGHFNDALQYAAILARQGIHHVDAGIADGGGGGFWGESNGYTIMLGGDDVAVKKLATVLTALAAADGKGWLHCGDSGAGHFVRMAQGLMERSVMQSFSQGMEFFGNWQGAAQMNPAALEKIWRHGGEVNNELQQLAEAYLAQSVTQTSTPTPAITLARSLSFAASGAKMYAQGLEALLKQRGAGQ